jgi:hypothetical protein
MRTKTDLDQRPGHAPATTSMTTTARGSDPAGATTTRKRARTTGAMGSRT